MSRKFDEVSLEELISAILNCDSKSKVLLFLDIPKNGSNTDKLTKFIEINNITTDHFKTKKAKLNHCLYCGKEIPSRSKYCNNTCRAKYEEETYIKRWLNGEESGLIGKDDIKTAVKNYLFAKYNNSCLLCSWNLVNLYTGRVPLLIHHIDGDCTNNKEDNLLLLCPNCHSLTENFGSRNKNCTRIDKRQR